jgi:hypothetical protein
VLSSFKLTSAVPIGVGRHYPYAHVLFSMSGLGLLQLCNCAEATLAWQERLERGQGRLGYLLSLTRYSLGGRRPHLYRSNSFL